MHERYINPKNIDLKLGALDADGELLIPLSAVRAAIAAAPSEGEWISVDDRLPTEEENDRGLVGIVNGHNDKIGFHDAIIFVDYDFEEKEWWSQDYNLIGCTVEFWMPLPKPPKMKGGAKE